MQTTRNIGKTTRTVRQMAEVQRDSYEALADNLAGAQRRTIGLAEGGFKLMRLQEENARVTQEWLANSLRLLQLQQKNAEFVQGWMADAVEVVREQTEQNGRTAEAFGRSVSRQQEGFRAPTQAWAGAYRDFFGPFAYFREGVRTFQRAAQKGLETTEQVARQGLRASEEATREAELRTAVVGALGTANYDELSVAEVSGRIEGLPTEQLKKVREFEKNHKNRETLIEQIDRKIRANENS